MRSILSLLEVSVLMSVYDGERVERLDSALKSIYEQPDKIAEVVLVQDGQLRPALVDVINNFQKKLNIVTLQIPQNLGLAEALNRGLELCSHEYIFRADSDDVNLAGRFRRQLDYMIANPEIDVCGAIVDEYDEKLENLLFTRTLPSNHDEIIAHMKYANPFSHPVVAFKKSVIVEAGGYPIHYPEDYHLWIKLFLNGARFANINEVLVKMRSGKEQLRRRGLRLAFGEFVIHRYMYSNGIITFPLLIFLNLTKFVLRSMPPFLKFQFYRLYRFITARHFG